jgi:tRNA(Ile)-lysidine synthase TilS/MesJ
VSVDGVTGTLILQKDYVPKYMLLWVKEGIVYALSGPGDSSTALAIAASIK